jgi:hypothetical protein
MAKLESRFSQINSDAVGGSGIKFVALLPFDIQSPNLRPKGEFKVRNNSLSLMETPNYHQTVMYSNQGLNLLPSIFFTPQLSHSYSIQLASIQSRSSLIFPMLNSLLSPSSFMLNCDQSYIQDDTYTWNQFSTSHSGFLPQTHFISKLNSCPGFSKSFLI